MKWEFEMTLQNWAQNPIYVENWPKSERFYYKYYKILRILQNFLLQNNTENYGP